MRRPTPLLILLIACSPLLAGAEGDRFTGTFTWGRNASQDLRVVFRPGEQGLLAAACTAVWKGEDHAYIGTFRIDHDSGEVLGQASIHGSNDYVVRGKLTDGVIEARFFQVSAKQEKPAGTLRVTRSAGE